MVILLVLLIVHFTTYTVYCSKVKPTDQRETLNFNPLKWNIQNKRENFVSDYGIGGSRFGKRLHYIFGKNFDFVDPNDQDY